MAAELPFPPPRERPDSLGLRWADLARGAGHEPAAPLVLALSGGADSVFLLQAAALAPERPRLVAVHVDHGLCGAESAADAEFCRALCRELGVPFVLRRALVDARPSGLEERARAARYAALLEEAEQARIATIATAHHADDALETLVLRWTRGSEAAGLSGLRAQSTRRAPLGGAIRVVRPLLGLRREELRALLVERGIGWREDSSNASPRFARNRVRGELLPDLEALGGPAALEALRGFAAAVDEFEAHCARFTADLAWQEPRFAAARARGAARLALAALAPLPAPLVRRVLARLLAERTGAIPERATLDRCVAALSRGARLATALPGGWTLRADAEELALDPPLAAPPVGYEARLAPNGFVRLPCGRALAAEIVPAGGELPRQPWRVELDAERLAPDLFGAQIELWVRYPRAGDRFHALGAEGSKRLARFLQDQRIPSTERAQVPLVVCGSEIVWVAGVRPAEAWAVRPSTRTRLALTLCHPERAGGAPRDWRDGDFGHA